MQQLQSKQQRLDAPNVSGVQVDVIFRTPQANGDFAFSAELWQFAATAQAGALPQATERDRFILPLAAGASLRFAPGIEADAIELALAEHEVFAMRAEWPATLTASGDCLVVETARGQMAAKMAILQIQDAPLLLRAEPLETLIAIALDDTVQQLTGAAMAPKLRQMDTLILQATEDQSEEAALGKIAIQQDKPSQVAMVRFCPV